jgi:hypothetical protein
LLPSCALRRLDNVKILRAGGARKAPRPDGCALQLDNVKVLHAGGARRAPCRDGCAGLAARLAAVEAIVIYWARH